MKNILIIDESERNRILEMHQRAKTFLLNEEIPYFYPKNNTNASSNINPKNLKLGDGIKNTSLRGDVKILQQKLINLGCLPSGSDDGKFGNYTNNALKKYQKNGSCGSTKTSLNKGFGDSTKTSLNKGFVLTFSFPTYKPKVDGNSKFDIMAAYVVKILTTTPKDVVTDLIKGQNPYSYDKTYGKLGHGGVATITSTGNVEVFEFGRYSGVKTKGFGMVVSKNLGKIAKIENDNILNLDDVVKKIKSKTEGEGPNLPMDWVLTIAPNIKEGIRYAKSVKEKDYSAADFSISNDAANCGTYALEVVKASGVNIPDKCFPTPNMMTREMKFFGIESGSV